MMKKKELIETSYIYIAESNTFNVFKSLKELTEWRLKQGYTMERIKWEYHYDCRVKVGETASYETRKNNLRYKDAMTIVRRVKFEGTKEERLFVEGYVRSKYSANVNMRHYGNDYFSCTNRNTVKGAKNHFFALVAEGFELLSQIKHKNYTFECEILEH